MDVSSDATTARARLDRWLDEAEYEGQHFEIKSDLRVGSRTFNAEVLKDLTAMGNGGGGAVVFGLSERKDGERSRVDGLSPLTDRMLVSRVQDLVNTSVRPNLMWSIATADVDGGYVLMVDVEPSRLGPYMVENLGEYRYWVRLGDRTAHMPERLVFDAYALATRRRALQQDRWSQLRLPVAATWPDWPHLTVSALPELDDASCCDPARLDREQLRSQPSEHAAIAGLDELTDSLSIWSDGFVAVGRAEQLPEWAYPRRRPQATLRIHRGGAIGLGVHTGTSDELDPVRALNAQLQYVGDVWDRVGVRAGSVRVELSGLGPRPANAADVPYPTPALERGEPYAHVSFDVDVRTAELCAATGRHGVLRNFADRLANLFGRPRATFGFEVGPLYQPGRRTELIAYNDRLHWAGVAYSQDPLICTDGAVRRPENPNPFGWWIDGLLVDRHGDAVAALEFCPAYGLPDDYLASDLARASVNEQGFRGRHDPSPNNPPWPNVTQRWIEPTAEDFIRSQPFS